MAREVLQALLVPLDGEPCLHCVERAAARKSRGLCHRCYGDRAVRVCYESGAVDEPVCVGPPPDVCPFPPGTKEKIAWLSARAEAGYSLFHQRDAKRGMQ